MLGEATRLPYSELQDIIFLEQCTDPSQQLKQKPDVELYRRFPWLEFKNPRHKKKYAYLGRETEQSHPFYVRFSLAQELEVGSALSSSEGSSVDEQLRQTVQGVLSPEGLQHERQWQEGIRRMHALAGTHTLFSSVCVHHGYLLTGIARPSATANDIYDALFVSLPRGCERAGGERTAVHNLMKLQWEYKYHSYEYLRFMSRAYRELSGQLAQRLPPDEVEEATSRELFNFSSHALLRFVDSQQQDQTMCEADYFTFFSGLLSRNHESILAQTEQPAHARIRTITLDGRPHELREFDFEGYLGRQFAGAEVAAESLARMAQHNRERHAAILLSFPFRTRRERVERLKRLANDNKEAYNRVELLPLADLREPAVSGEEDRHFLILFRREEGVGEAGCSLREVLDRRAAQGQAQGALRAEDVRLYKERLFQDIHRQQTWADEYPLLNCFSCDPTSLLLEEGVLVPDFAPPLRRYLQLHQLPLTQEQQLLACTPRPEINLYEKLEELVEEYEQCLREGTLDELCSLLSGEQLTFERCDGSELKMGAFEEMEGEPLRLKMKLLQVSMIDYEIAHNRRCLHATSSNSEDLPYNAFTPAHYHQSRQQLAVLLVRAALAPALKYAPSSSPLPSSSPPSANLAAIEAICSNYRRNCLAFKKYVEENADRRFFRQVDQNTFRRTIRGFFEDLEGTLPGFHHKAVREALRVAHKAHIVMEFLEARLLLSKGEDGCLAGEEAVSEGLEQLRPCVEAAGREEKQEGKSELYERCKVRYPLFCKDLKEGFSFIQKELALCRELLQLPSLRSAEGLEAMRSESPERLREKMQQVGGYGLLWLCSVYAEVAKYEEAQLVYKVLACFCCHLPQFHRNQVLQHDFTSPELSRERLEEKVYKLKNVLLTELADFIVRNKQKYLPTPL